MIYGRTSHSFEHLTSNVDYFSDDSLIHKLCLVNKLNCCFGF
jgi:hypothetical protein